VLLTGSSNPQGLTKYRCEISHQSDDKQSSQEQEAKRFDLDQKITDQIQLMLSDLNIKAVPPSFEGDSKGINYMLKMEDGFQSATYVWSHNSPKGWGQLQELASLILDLTK